MPPKAIPKSPMKSTTASWKRKTKKCIDFQLLAFEKIPNNACLALTVKGDDAFNRESKTMVKMAKSQKQKCVEARKEGARWVLEPLAV